MNRRKLKPFHIERTAFGDGDGKSLEDVVPTGVDGVGQLSCGVRHHHVVPCPRSDILL